MAKRTAVLAATAMVMTMAATPAPAAPAAGLALTSTAFADNAKIPDHYTCAFDHKAGRDVSPPLAWTGGDTDGGLGTNVAGILEAIEAAWSTAGVAILVDLGGAETNSEMAVEMLAEDRRARVVVCNAPVVEGAVIAATESSGGSSLAAVKRSAEEFYA